MSYSLRTELAGIDLINPFIIGACPSTRSAEQIIRAANTGWAGAVTKTLTRNPPYSKNPTPFLDSIQSKRRIIGLFNNESYTEPTITDWCNGIIPSIIKQAPSDFVLIGSIMEGSSGEQWAITAQMLENAGVHMIEMNVSCPHGTPAKYMGKFVSDDPELLYQVVKKCVLGVKIPVLVKLSADTIDLSGAARACEQAGAAGIVSTNTILGIAGVDLESFVPKPSFEGMSTYSGYSGDGIRPIALRAIADIAMEVNIPVIGVGGISTWEHAVEFVLCGATAVQLATSVMLRGFQIIEQLTVELEKYLHRHNENSIHNLCGRSLKKLVSTERLLQVNRDGVAKVDMSACTLCDLCVNPCRDGAANCITITADLLIIDEDKCTGCGLCVQVCPFDALVVV